jgi:endonuclease-3
VAVRTRERPRASSAGSRKRSPDGKGTSKRVAKKTPRKRHKRLPEIDVKSQIRTLKRLYPGARCSLDHRSPFQLLVSTILSAQCTDERVNRVTPGLFARYPGPREFADEELPEIEEAIRSTGFFRSKSKAIQEASRDILEKHGGDVPSSLGELVELRGVGRKTANVVLGDAFGVPGVVVDTHVSRLSKRMGLTRESDPVKIEFDLMERIPKTEWTLYSHLLIHHGRAVCQSRKPRCAECALARYCPKVGVPAEITREATRFETATVGSGEK